MKHRVLAEGELLSLLGDVAVGPDGKPAVHAHAVLGLRAGGTKTYRPELGLSLVDV